MVALLDISRAFEPQRSCGHLVFIVQCDNVDSAVVKDEHRVFQDYYAEPEGKASDRSALKVDANETEVTAVCQTARVEDRWWR